MLVTLTGKGDRTGPRNRDRTSPEDSASSSAHPGPGKRTHPHWQQHRQRRQSRVAVSACREGQPVIPGPPTRASVRPAFHQGGNGREES